MAPKRGRKKGNRPSSALAPETESPAQPPPLVLPSNKLRGVYECDCCRVDISQGPRIRCAVCPEFDLCLDCFSRPESFKIREASKKAATALQEEEGKTVTLSVQHLPSHGYRVADCIRYPLFPHNKNVILSRTSTVEENSTAGSTEVPGKDRDGDESDNEVRGKDQEDENTDGMEIDGVDASKKDKKVTGSKEDGGKQKKGDDTGSSSTVSEDGLDKLPESDCDEIGDDESQEKERQSDRPKKRDSTIGTSMHSETGSTFDVSTGSVSSRRETQVVFSQDSKTSWTADQDLRLLEAIKTHGLGNWPEIGEAVAGTPSFGKNCMERYLDDFLGQYGRILPKFIIVELEDAEEEEEDLDEVVGAKRRRRTIRAPYSGGATSVPGAAGSDKRKKTKVVPTSSIPGFDEIWPQAYVPPIGVCIGQDVGRDKAYKAENAYIKALQRASSKEDAKKVREEWLENRLNKPGGPTVLPPLESDLSEMVGADLAGFMPRRGDLDTEFDNEAEAIVADMEFSALDTPQERQLKIKIIEIYNKKLDDREKNKRFLIDRDLLNYRKNQEADEKLPSDERSLVHRLRLFARFHSPEDHEKIVIEILEAKRLRKEITSIQRYLRMGITSLAEVERYELDKKRREAHKQEYFSMNKDQESGKKGVEGPSSWRQYKPSDRSRRVKRGGESAGATPDSPIDADSSNVTHPVGESKPDAPSTGDASEPKKDAKGDGMKEDEKANNIETETSSASAEKKEGLSCSQNEDGNVITSEATTESKGDCVSGAHSSNKMGVATQESNAAASGGAKVVADHREEEFDVRKCPHSKKLQAKEIELCEKHKLSPKLYLELKKALILEAFKVGLVDVDTRGKVKNTIARVDVETRDNIVKFIARAGWISSKALPSTMNGST